MKRMVQKGKIKFMEVESKALQFNLHSLGEAMNLTEIEIDDLTMLKKIADGHCHQFGVPQWFIMNTESIKSADGKEYYPVQFFGR
ncbi:MAG TPA: hypothetical protein VHQ41_02560 [Patescibacteria group bacterium]|jgi:hypothetical protein|nr:hypothetical protein [Patescibacteria group bacterium]